MRRVTGVIGVRNEIAVRAAQDFSQPTRARLVSKNAKYADAAT